MRFQLESTPLKITGGLFVFLFFFSSLSFGQSDSTKNEIFSFHGQTTVINQYKPAFDASYSGVNSLSSQQEQQTSITGTLFLGARLWKGASVYFNPEIAGGSGLSGALGIAAATNGETYRVGDPKPAGGVARFYFRQQFSFGENKEYIVPDLNQLGGMRSTSYFAVTIGKVSLADYFDANSFSHDPRSQFMSWGLMENGAWDYCANVKGYTPSAVLEYVTPMQELRYHVSLVPLSANSDNMNWNVGQASGHSLEYTFKPKLKSGTVIFRLLGFYNTANMGNYKESIVLAGDTVAPSIIDTRKFGRSKYGITFNVEVESASKLMGAFFRAGWNDGTNETWMFTEIDRTVSLGGVLKGNAWERKNDVFGVAGVFCGLSSSHVDYLKAGGHGFMLGDGTINYAMETLFETYYSCALNENIAVSAVYQHVINPGYNKDRGPVDVFSIRVHVEL